MLQLVRGGTKSHVTGRVGGVQIAWCRSCWGGPNRMVQVMLRGFKSHGAGRVRRRGSKSHGAGRGRRRGPKSHSAGHLRRRGSTLLGPGRVRRRVPHCLVQVV